MTNKLSPRQRQAQLGFLRRILLSAILTEHIDELRKAFHYVKEGHPFQIEAIAILPDHWHCIWTLPSDDADFSVRWNLIKGSFSSSLNPSSSLKPGERRSKSRIKRRERASNTFIYIPLKYVSNTFIGIRLNTVGCKRLLIGRIRVSIIGWRVAFFPQIGWSV